jgi:transcriptional regulator with AAA-type ATPase domain
MDPDGDGAASERAISCDVLQPHLVVLFDRAHPLLGSSRHSLAGVERVRIGHGARRGAWRGLEDGHFTLRLSVPDERVAAEHATMERTGNSWSFVDKGSPNGSWLGSRVAGETPARTRIDRIAIHDGDVLELGRMFFRFREGVRSPAHAPLDVDACNLRGLPARCSTHYPWMVRDLDVMGRIARSDLPIVLLGETGTGKEVLARAIHEESMRPGPFVAVNCAALPTTLVESLLFGHKKGTFSGAARDELGLVRAAEGGTLFLDEIGDLAPDAQAALLRVLQENEVVPLGATRPVHVDIRVVAATHRLLDERIRTGAFREDLFARLAAYVYRVPPLRERIDDIGILIGAILHKIDSKRSFSLGADASHALVHHRWPLNVRELEQHLKAGAVLGADGRLALADLALRPTLPPPPPMPPPGRPRASSKQDDALYAELLARLEEHGGNVTRASVAMGKARTQVQRWVRRFGIDLRQFRD